MLRGTKINIACDALREISIRDLYETVVHPDESLSSLVRGLRIMKEMDENAYRKGKKDLPYVVCGSFNPTFRRTENFVYTDCFIIDLDGLEAKGKSIEQTRRQVEQDPRVAMTFISPSGDGLKILFRLSEKCYDAAQYKLFYKAFVSDFSSRYALDEICDCCTSDVTRACFLSEDTEAFYRENSEGIDFKTYLDEDNPFSYKFDEEFQQTEQKVIPYGPDEDDIERIKQTLFKRKSAIVQKKDVYVPEEVDAIVEELAAEFAGNNISLDNVVSIQYGKKFQISCIGKRAEVNVFYGRRGFSVVPTPKRGTDAEFNGIIADWIVCHLQERGHRV